MKTILALDLGTHCGWAYRSKAGKISAGTWTLATDRAITEAGKARMDRKLDPRIPTFYRHLTDLLNLEGLIEFMVFEDVQFSRYTQQTQLWSSFRAVAWLFAYLHRIKTDCIPVTTLKQFATGSGAADKDFMMRTAAKLFPTVEIVDDNCADALHLLQWATTITARVK